MRPDPITPEHREEVIVHMAAGLLAAHKYFREKQEAYADSFVAPTAASQGSQDRTQRPMPVRLRREIQTVCGRATVN